MKIGTGEIVSLAFMLIMGLQACVSSENGPDCPYPSIAKLDSIHQVFYQPYFINRYALPTDTVAFEDFSLTVEFGFSVIEKPNSANERTYPGACAALFHAQNISNIELYLTSPYEGVKTGSEVSYLFQTADGTALNRFRDFKNMNTFLSLRLKERPSKPGQINTRLVVYLRDGRSKSMESSSPFIR